MVRGDDGREYESLEEEMRTLILEAAAPAMLRALKSVIHATGGSMSRPPAAIRTLPVSVRDEVRAAIAEAEKKTF